MPVAGDIIAPPVFTHLTPADGLPYPVALAVTQDRHGFIWAATPGGAARWDGYRMTVFRHDANDANSLPDNIVTAATADELGQIWLSTVSGVVVRYDGATRGFTAYRDQGNSFGRLNGIVSDGKGGIWVAGRQGLARLDVATRAWRRETGVAVGEVGSVLVDRSGRLWAGATTGLVRQQGRDLPFEQIPIPGEIKGDMVSALFEDGEGTVWFGTRQGRVGRVRSNGEVTLETAVPPSGYRITAFAEPRPGIVWVSQYGGGIHELRRASGAVRTFLHEPTIATSLGDNSVTGLLVDRSGLVWVSSLRGIHQHIPSNQSLVTIVPGGRGGLPGADVRSVGADPNGNVWLGFRAEGLASMDPTGRIIRTVAPGLGPEDLPHGVIQAVADTADGNVWIGQLGGLYRLDTTTGKATSYGPLAGANILALRHEGRNLWVGSTMGLTRIALDGAPARTYRFDREKPDSLSDDSVMAIFRDSAQRLWVGTQRGLNVLEDADRGVFRRFLNDPSDPESLPSDIVNGVAEDRGGRIWLATGNGIGLLDPKAQGQPRFIRLGRAQGLTNDTVLSVIAAPNSMLAGTGAGLSLIDPQTHAIRAFGPAEGAHIRTFWAGAATRMADGALVLGGFGGMTIARPGTLPGWEFRPPVVVTEVRVGGQVRSSAEEILVRPEDGGFQVDFAALDFSSPERNRYAYRLVGNDADWIQIDSHHRTAGYTNLSPGTYRLELRGSNSVGLWSDPPKALDVRVLPAWYQTQWFRFLVGAALLASLVGADRMRKAYHLRREQELTRQVAAKTAEAEAAKLRALAGEEQARRAKEAAEAADQQKSRFLAVIGHEIRTPLNGLLGMLQLLEPGLAEKASRELLMTAREAGDTLRHLVENVLEYGREGAKRSEVLLEDVELRRLATEQVELIRLQAEAKGLDLHLDIVPDGPIWVRCDQIKLSRILINLLGNAVKFTEQGSVAVEIAFVPEAGRHRLTLRVTDTGIGIPPELQDAIFKDFVQGDDSITRQYGGAGLGLAISRRMAEQMRGTLTVNSTPGAGSTFCLDLMVDGGKPAVRRAEMPRTTGDPRLRVLVVDDDAVNRRVAEQLLLRLGHTPAVVANGEEAIAAVVGGIDIDAILMDVRMPNMDGMEVARRIREWEKGRQKRRVWIVAMTADLNDDIWRECAAAGMDGGLSKPAQLERLREALLPCGSPDLPTFPGHHLVDAAFFREQLDVIGAAEMIRLARLFRKTSRQMMDALDVAVDGLDRSAIRALAHRLRSATGPLGLVDMADKAARVEAEAGVAAQDFLREQVALLRAARRFSLDALVMMARAIRSGHVGSTLPPNL